MHETYPNISPLWGVHLLKASPDVTFSPSFILKIIPKGRCGGPSTELPKQKAKYNITISRGFFFNYWWSKWRALSVKVHHTLLSCGAETVADVGDRKQRFTGSGLNKKTAQQHTLRNCQLWSLNMWSVWKEPNGDIQGSRCESSVMLRQMGQR